MSVMDKVAYLKGLADGIGLDEGTNEGRLLKAIIDVLDEMAATAEDLEDSVDELASEIEAIDEDLASLEEDFYDEYDYDYEDEDYIGLTCPKCGDEIYFDEADFEDDRVLCPACGEEINFEFDCCCGQDHEKEDLKDTKK